MDKYAKYTRKDFLKDTDFILHVLYPTQESEEFWSRVIENHPGQYKNMVQATQLISSAQLNVPDISQEEIDKMFHEIKAEYNANKGKETKNKKRIHRFNRFRTVAAIALICMVSAGILYILNKTESSNKNYTETIDKIEKEPTVKLVMGNNTLTFVNNTDIVLEDNLIKITEKESGSSYVAKTNDEVRINNLIVPFGRQSSLTLPDGSRLWINSGTTVSFPSRFTEERYIEIEGEIFIDVAPDAQAPFYVKSTLFDVKVLGTQFNVSVYPNEQTQTVVLAQGKVEIATKKSENKVILAPGEMYSLTDGDIKVTNVEVYNHISWKDGVLSFREETLSSIANRLSRYYNVNISCDEKLESKTCTGKLVLFPDVHETLHILSDIFDVKYTHHENKIEIISNP